MSVVGLYIQETIRTNNNRHRRNSRHEINSLLDGYRLTLTEIKKSYQGITVFISPPDFLKNRPEKRSETSYKSEKFTPSKIEVELESVTYLPM